MVPVFLPGSLLPYKYFMIEITKWPVVIFTNYRTGSSALGYMLQQKYGAPYFEEPAQHLNEIDQFINFYRGKSSDRFIIKFMVDQVKDLDIYGELLESDAVKIRLQRNDELKQCISYYIATARQEWIQRVESVDKPYSVDTSLREMTWAATAIHQNNVDLRNSNLNFDLDLIYEDLDLSGNGEHFPTSRPDNYDEVKSKMQTILLEKNFGHYNSGWNAYGHQSHVAAKNEEARSGYLFNWFYKDHMYDVANTNTSAFYLTETRPSTDIPFFDMMMPPEKYELNEDTSTRQEVMSDVRHVIEHDARSHPFLNTVISYPGDNVSVMTDDTCRVTEHHYSDRRFLYKFLADPAQQVNYWDQHQYNKKNNISFDKQIVRHTGLVKQVFGGRAPGDEFTFSLFMSLINDSKIDADLVYLWSSYFTPGVDFFLHNKQESEYDLRFRLFNHINKDTVIMGVKDHMTNKDGDGLGAKPAFAQYLSDMFTFYKDKKFILLTSMEKLDSYITNANVHIVPWGGDITNHANEYKTIDPVLDKNLDSQRTFISLNRNSRWHRDISVKLLHGLGIQDQGLISCMFDLTPGDGMIPFNDKQQHIKLLLDQGYDNFDINKLLSDDRDIYLNNHNDNPNNFKTLSNYYSDVFVEIVSETSYLEKSFLLTEKTLNSIYGCNFPIILSSPSTVAFLRAMGMDMFDDIIDHSYDLIEDPIDRVYTAITSNIELLSDNIRTKQLWVANKERFVNNIAFAKTQMYEYYLARAKEKFNQAIA